jgi:hypothetical protein
MGLASDSPIAVSDRKARRKGAWLGTKAGGAHTLVGSEGEAYILQRVNQILDHPRPLEDSRPRRAQAFYRAEGRTIPTWSRGQFVFSQSSHSN